MVHEIRADVRRWPARSRSRRETDHRARTQAAGDGSGSAVGQIYLRNTCSTKLYVQFKPNEGGLWNRGTSNVSSAAYYFNWSDNFHLPYTGFMFRICQDKLGPDSCGSARMVYA